MSYPPLATSGFTRLIHGGTGSMTSSRRADVRKDIEDAIIGHASDGSGPGYGEYAIIDMLGPAVEKTRSPFDVEPI